ncbi:hypothetical protein NMY22_g12334 [Coprinellus aureogranulatus]|nr:hypothetical protein NMY22_g12334 [Coprinellus aureogranulatus]
MNSNSPGNGPQDEDIEMRAMDDVAEPPPKYHDGSATTSDSEDEFDVDDGERGLLGGSGHAERDYAHLSKFSTAGRLWHQVKSIVVEAAPALLLTTVSLLFTGKLLDTVSHWDAMLQVDQLIMIIPTILNLQGNLEMNLSARLSTAANIGELDDPAVMRSMLLGNWTMLQLDPDNIAPAVASCLGDLVTLCLVGVVSTLLLPLLRTPIPFILGIAMVVIAVACMVYTARNPHVKQLLTQGWSPLFGAMVISSATGIVLDMFVSRYEGFAIMAIVISGLPGAAGSIFVSRLSTSLHASAIHAGNSLRASEPSRKLVMITLLLITIPVEIIFLTILNAFGWLKIHIFFILFSVLFFCCAVLASLTIAKYLTDWLWSKNRDPDLYALPLHSALMDLIGQLLLVLCFEIVTSLGAKLHAKTYEKPH